MPRRLPSALLGWTGVLVGASAVAGEARCGDRERALWWCDSGRQAYALCASDDLSAQRGYLQYRVRSAGRTEFEFPASRVHPRGRFVLSLRPRGASLDFVNDEHAVTVHEPLVGRTTIDVTRGGAPLSTRSCRAASDTLTATEVQALLREAGVFP